LQELDAGQDIVFNITVGFIVSVRLDDHVQDVGGVSALFGVGSSIGAWACSFH